MSRLFGLLLALFLTSGTPARADELKPGYIEFTQVNQSQWRLVWKAPMRGGVLPATQPMLPSGCQFSGQAIRQKDLLAVTSQFEIVCSGDVAGKKIGLSSMDVVQTDILLRVAPLHRPVQIFQLNSANPSATIQTRSGRLQVAGTYFRIGVEHILFGYDHLLFVVLLVLLLTGLWTITKAVTAFTIAHSITLVGTTLGILGLPQRPVEAVIALSITFLAVEIVKKKEDEPRLSERFPWVVALLFGLLHGFGFAGALREVGLPEGELPAALFTFNIGVEAGQLTIVATTILAVATVQRFAAHALRPAIKSTAYAIGIISCQWLIARVVL
jgi:hydrogenase/urease accessory protein HupE